MSEEVDDAAVGGDLAQMLDVLSRPVPDRISELATPIVPVAPLPQRAAGGEVAFHRRPHLVARQADPQRLAVELRHRLARLKSELRIEAKRAIMVGRLQEPDPGDAAARATLDHIEHQPTADRMVLRAGIDGDRADAGDRTALVEKAAAGHLAVALGNNRIDPGVGQQHLDAARRNLRRREVPWEIVLARDRLERLEADRTA